MEKNILDQFVDEGRISSEERNSYAFHGEMNEEGLIFPKNGLLSKAIKARKEGKKGIFVHPDQIEEGAIVNDIAVLPVSDVASIGAYFSDKASIDPVIRDTREIFSGEQEKTPNDMADIIEDENAKHALEIAAIGLHHVLLYGDPRSGKDRLVEHLPGILSRLTLHEALEVTRRYSNEGKMKKGMGLIAHRPLQKVGPYTSFDEAKRQIYLSHNGVLWLQEVSEIDSKILEFLDQVLLNGSNTIFWREYVQPCRPMVVATSSSPELPEILKPYIDIFLDIPIIEAEDHLRFEDLESSLEIRERVESAVTIQRDRYAEYNHRRKAFRISGNGDLSEEMTKESVKLDNQTRMLLNISLKKQGVDPKMSPQILRVARSIADRVGEKQPLLYHVAEAIHYLSPG